MPLLQEIAAVSLVCVAAAYVGFRAWQTLTKKQPGGCGGGGCAKCPGGEQPAQTPGGFVSVDQVTGPRDGAKH